MSLEHAPEEVVEEVQEVVDEVKTPSIEDILKAEEALAKGEVVPEYRYLCRQDLSDLSTDELISILVDHEVKIPRRGQIKDSAYRSILINNILIVDKKDAPAISRRKLKRGDF